MPTATFTGGGFFLGREAVKAPRSPLPPWGGGNGGFGGFEGWVSVGGWRAWALRMFRQRSTAQPKALCALTLLIALFGGGEAGTDGRSPHPHKRLLRPSKGATEKARWVCCAEEGWVCPPLLLEQVAPVLTGREPAPCLALRSPSEPPTHGCGWESETGILRRMYRHHYIHPRIFFLFSFLLLFSGGGKKAEAGP